MVSEHRASFLVSDAALCGRGASLARWVEIGSGVPPEHPGDVGRGESPGSVRDEGYRLIPF
jgi:hypothetical protein